MIRFIHRGMGGKYTNYISQAIRNIARCQAIEFSSNTPSSPGYRVAISKSGQPLTASELKDILSKQNITFFLGDSKGLPKEILDESDAVYSVSSLNVPHQLEAAILIGEVESLLRAGRGDV